jgi:Domain of Unknown Function (DUF1080)
MKKCFLWVAILLAPASFSRAAETKDFVGAWDLTIPEHSAGWLGVKEQNGQLQASLMWIAGSVEPLASAAVEDGKLLLKKDHNVELKDAGGKTYKTNLVETLTGTLEGDRLKLVSVQPKANGSGEQRVEATGVRQPPLPPAPDLAKVRFGRPVKLFNGKDLTGWRLTDPHAVNGWSVKEGILRNDPIQEEGKPHKPYGNLRTDREFEDFNITLEVRLPKKGNSGVYLRGIYEIQVADSYGQPASVHGMGALYSRIAPRVNACKPAGEWQKLDITLVDQHVTVVHNGEKLIDNQAAEGCTGGALWSDVTRPGPIYLQGDHTGVEYRNIVIRPVVKGS